MRLFADLLQVAFFHNDGVLGEDARSGDVLGVYRGEERDARGVVLSLFKLFVLRGKVLRLGWGLLRVGFLRLGLFFLGGFRDICEVIFHILRFFVLLSLYDIHLLLRIWVISLILVFLMLRYNKS